MSDDVEIELRGADSVEDATLQDIWVADQPLGKIIERQRKRIDELESKIEAVEETAVDANKTAETALGTAGMTDTGIRADGNPSKVEIVRQTARDHLVKNGLKHNEQSLTLTKLMDMCEPEHDVAYQTAKDAAKTLATRWEGLALGENVSGTKSLKADPSEYEKSLVGVVEESLGRDDLTKELISRRRGDRQ
ncbi:hypothetical protein BRD20_10080 [Halobacteriales archaeon SW_8_65_20]|nr:MAG: hypothetical protein BRD20_10080 [Halobacteriales archaeon SW_8_65_20]